MYKMLPCFIVALMTVSLPAPAQTEGMPAHPAPDELFDILDTNDDSLLSRQEAQSLPGIAEVYDSMDTRATIQQPDQNTARDGITRAQFLAGMEAARKSGAFGPSVSGGQTYWVYPDGSRVEANDAAGHHP